MHNELENHIVTKNTIIVLGIYSFLFVGLFYSSFLIMIKWWEREDYSYGYLMPFIILYLLWEKRYVLLTLPSKLTFKGFILLGAGLLFFWLGELGGEYFALFFSSWLSLVGLCWIHLGYQKLKIITFPLFLSLTMFPLPQFIHLKLSFNLKLISSQLGVKMMQLMGMTAYREGNVIDLGFTQLQVVDACSGLRYLIPLIIMGFLFAYFFQKSWWKRIVLVFSTIPIAVLINGLRIFSVGFLYQFWGASVAEGFFHDFSGWLILMVSVFFLYVEVLLLKKLGKKENQKIRRSEVKSLGLEDYGVGVKQKKEDWNERRLEGDDAEGESGRRLEDEKKLSAISKQQSTISKLLSPHFIVAVVLLGITLVASHAIDFREKIPSAQKFSKFPLTIGEWTGATEAMEQKFIDELDFSDYVMVNYLNKKNQYVSFYVAYYESQQKGESIHSPDTCLPGGGYTFNASGLTELPITQNNGAPMIVKRAFIQKGDAKQLAYYWYPMRGRILTNAYQMKFYTFWDALTRQRTDGALVRLITPVYPNENIEDADIRLKEFSKEIIPMLGQFLPN